MPIIKWLEFQQEQAVFRPPDYTLDLIRRYLDGKLQVFCSRLTQDELLEAVRKAEKGYIYEDDVFILTDEGRRAAEELFANE